MAMNADTPLAQERIEALGQQQHMLRKVLSTASL
jgi:hypothetical protein